MNASAFVTQRVLDQLAEVGAQKEKWDKLEHKKEEHSVVASPTLARDLVTLEQWRGGWQRGNRRFCLRLYAHFLKSAGTCYAETCTILKSLLLTNYSRGVDRFSG